MKNLFAFLLLSFVCMGPVGAQKKTASKVKQVTVFPEGAQVVREASVFVPAGKTELVFEGLSPYTSPSSLQVAGQGKFVIVSVSPQPNKLKGQKERADVSGWEKSREQLTAALNRESTLFEVYAQEEKMLEANHKVSGANSDLKAADLRAAMDFHRERLSEIRLQQIVFQQRIDQLNDTIQKLSAQIAAAHKLQDGSTVDVVVAVDAKEAGPGDFNISYVVGNAGWFPSYDLRVNELNEPLLLSYKANVFQNTGEEWKDVHFLFSNGNPNETGVAPRLMPLFLNNNPISYRTNSIQPINPNIREVSGKVTDEQGEGVISATVLVVGSSIGTVTDFDGNYSIKIPSNGAQLKFSYVGYEPVIQTIYSEKMHVQLAPSVTTLEEVMVTASKSVFDEKVSIRGSRGKANGYYAGAGVAQLSNVDYQAEKPHTNAVRFELAAPYTLLHDGKTRAVEMKLEAIPAAYEYYCVPKLEKKAYLQAHVVNWEEYNLLDGEANLYYEGTYTGKTLLSLQDADDTLHLSLGADKAISVNRNRVKDFSKRQFLADNKIASAAFEISIRNTKKFPIKLVVEDQIPVSNVKEITVDKADTDGGETDALTGKVRWNVELAPAKEWKKKLSYTVKYPSNYRVQID